MNPVDPPDLPGRRLGDAGPRVSALGLGCLGLSGGYGPVSEADAVDVVRHAIDLGVTLVDTADFYGDGRNEELVGRAVAGRRDEVVIATRGGVRTARPGGPPSVVDGRPVSLRDACHASLRRLGVDHIDLYYLGRVDPAVPVADSVGALAELVQAGKVGHIGLSEATPDQVRAAHSVHPVSALETEYSLWERHAEAAILPTVRELGIGFVAHTPLGKGMLTGVLRYPGELGERDMRRNHPRFQGTNFARNRELVDELELMALARGLTPAQLALAWLLARGDDVVPIPGTRSRDRLAENLAALRVRLPADESRRLTELFTADRVAGPRLPVRR
ncbi:aldo/keto reductase [Virgisporangium aurantiacum]|uniref:Oxidoreductase n=1 Tax=Virgisporangium aurantiacum TaxID=175570 RepID=A0A8J4E3S2_9ACTN|nr:aldo/keto reductase [Virgisporangium aurantiacum]GIJ60416.1 oxidoreductase [Virgisporangium aurantiacum]